MLEVLKVLLITDFLLGLFVTAIAVYKWGWPGNGWNNIFYLMAAVALWPVVVYGMLKDDMC